MPRRKDSEEDIARMDAIRVNGMCPHDTSKCFYAKLCNMSKEDSCAVMISCAANGCHACFLRNRCQWNCFRKTTKR